MSFLRLAAAGTLYLGAFTCWGLPQNRPATLSEVRYWSTEDYTRVVLHLDREVEFEKSILTNPDRIYFDLKSARLEAELADRVYEVDGLFIQRIRLAQNRSDVVRIVLDFDQISRHTVFALYDPFRLVIDTRGELRSGSSDRKSVATGQAPMKTAEATIPLEKGADRPAEFTEGSAAPTTEDDLTLTRVLGLKVGRVVIDPGHGGRDTGTIGPGGLLEKELVLDVALRLEKLLNERLGIDTVLTRKEDRYLPLEERTAIANQVGADLFISIHANASRDRMVSGIETYVLDFATSQAEREIAGRENAGAQRNIRELENILRQIALEDYNQESRGLAAVVQDRLYTFLYPHRPELSNRGIKQAPFIVLIGSNMPSILTEIGFISNPKDEAYFKTSQARDHVADALYQGIAAYFQSLGSLPAQERAAGAP